MSYIPVHPLNVAFGGIPQAPPQVTSSTPVYSNYTGNLIGYGQIAKGTPNDAPSNNPQHGGVFHVIQYNIANKQFIAHNQ